MDPPSAAEIIPLRRRPFPSLSPAELVHSGAMEFLRLFRPPPSSSSSSDAVLIDRFRPPNAAEDGQLSIRIIRSEDMDLSRPPDANAATSAANLLASSSASSSSSVSSSVSSSSSTSLSPAAVSALPVTVSEVPRNSSSSLQAETAESEPAMNQRYDLQLIGRWLEQVLPFCLLLLTVFIRKHLQGFLLTLLLSISMIKSNDFLKKQTALKGERKSLYICLCGGVLSMQIIAVYWWCTKDLLRSLIILPPKEVPEFWHAVFIILMNDILVRLGAMVLKAGLLIYYKNRRGRNYRLQGQLLTLIEYFILLYRALLPTPVWYRFFLNKEYGSFFSSLTTGLYLTFKLTYLLEKINLFIAALKALSRKEMQFGSYATAEEIIAGGDICAICQEKMHTPILLSCKHLFCEDCVSEWLERERTCPLCRALVKPADLKSFGDGSTSLFYQMF